MAELSFLIDFKQLPQAGHFSTAAIPDPETGMTTTFFAPAALPRQRRATHAALAMQATLASQFYASPDWWRLRSAIMAALQDHPEARESVSQTMRALHAMEEPAVEVTNVPSP